jgi:hypothetical protein
VRRVSGYSWAGLGVAANGLSFGGAAGAKPVVVGELKEGGGPTVFEVDTL